MAHKYTKEDYIKAKNGPKIKREKSYWIRENNLEIVQIKNCPPITNRHSREEHLAIRIFNNYRGKEHKELGEILDYQIPLKNAQSDAGLGKFDLIARKDNVLQLIELKYPTNTESCASAIYEISTYAEQVDLDKLCSDFKCPPHIPQKVVLISKNSSTYRGYVKKHKQLAKDMEVEILVLEEIFPELADLFCKE